MRAAVLSALLVPVFLTGCSTYVTVVSEPEGAVITDASGSIVYGRAPLDVEYDTNELRHGAHPGQCAQIPGFTARWPSGASAAEAREIISLLRNTIGTHHAQRQKGGHLRP